MSLENALSFAAQGFPVFPCRNADNYDAEKDAVLKEKTPLTSNGFKDATTSERIIKILWDKHPNALIGIPTGEKSGFWVLDIDVPPKHEDGRPWLAAMEAQYGTLVTRKAETGSGGLHYLFKHAHGIRNADVASGVESRGEGGYFIAPGSKMEDGREYKWLNDEPIADAPDWLLDILLKPKHVTAEYNAPILESAGAAEINEMLHYVSPDCGYQDWVSVLMAVHSALGSGGLAIADAWSSRGLKYRKGEVAQKWKGFSTSGGVNLGSLAELARQGGADLSAISRKHKAMHHEDNTNLDAIKDMIERALAKPIENGDSKSESENPIQTLDTATAEEAPKPHEPKSAFVITPFSWRDPKSLPTREFAFGQHYIRKYVSVTVSPGGLGKTSNSIVEALSMVSGKPLTGVKPKDKLNVFLFNAEDPRDEMARRIMAACVHYRLSDKDIAGRLFMDTGREQELVIMHEDRKTGLKINEPVVEAIVEQIHQHNIDVMIIDPFVSTHRVNENDNGAIDKVAKLWAQIADRTNCAIDVVHHLRKLADREATVEDARGAVSLIGAARSVRVLNRMSQDQEKQANLDEGHRFSYFWIEHGKSNLTKMDSARHWRKLESVPLNNGGDGEIDFMLGDQVGVVTEWTWPTKDEIAASIPTDVRAIVVARMGNMNCRESTQSPDWAGYVLADAMGTPVDVDRAMTPEKRRIKAALDSWISNGILAVVDEPDRSGKHVGRTVKYIRPAGLPTT